MTVVGRIPGKQGLWELSVRKTRIESLRGVDRAPDEEESRRWITPGLFDVQINGIAGIDFANPSIDVESLGRADQLIRSRGVSRFCPTLVTCSLEEARAALATFHSAWERGALKAAWAIHLEGPWISSEDGFRGVHRLRDVRDPSVEELDILRTASGDRVRLVTLAPEREGSLRFITAAVSRGITVSLGHTNATAQRISEAVAAGASMSTHLFNGCAQLVHRHVNPIYAQLAEDALWACFLADGHHVPWPTLKVGLRAKGVAKSILASDIVWLSGSPEGEYVMEGNSVELRDGGLFVKGTRMLSGAVRTLDEDVELLARQPEPGIENALLMATRNPARALGDEGWAELCPGREGPIAVFAWDGRNLALEERVGF